MHTFNRFFSYFICLLLVLKYILLEIKKVILLFLLINNFLVIFFLYYIQYKKLLYRILQDFSKMKSSNDLVSAKCHIFLHTYVSLRMIFIQIHVFDIRIKKANCFIYKMS